MLKNFSVKLMLCFIAFFVVKQGHATEGDDFIIVKKKNVLHVFVPADPATDHFTRNVFPGWENDTFDLFDRVKDKNKIAIDIGAWIGTTAIWLSHNFQHVIAVEPDIESIECLKRNLEASGCNNVSICTQPIADTHAKVIFGPRGKMLNESISFIKKDADNEKDYITDSLTFKQLVHDYVFAKENLASRDIAFIKCDIEGGEEDILEDLLYFAYYNNCKVYISFHLDWWKTKKIEDFQYLFKFFSINCPTKNVCKYLYENPFASLLFEPRKNEEVLIKKNMPVVVIGYNQFSYIKNMVKQMEKYTSDIIVIDNNSTFKPLLDYYDNDFKYTLLRQKTNLGHTVYLKDFVQKFVGDTYILTDPDLLFNPKLPDNFIQNLLDISKYFEASRIGFALLIDSDDIRTDIPVKSWEAQFWKEKIVYPPNRKIDLYKADIDTTFCLINKKFYQPHMRIAGDYTCIHMPWHTNFQNKLEKGEFESYLQGNISTNWFRFRNKK